MLVTADERYYRGAAGHGSVVMLRDIAGKKIIGDD